MSNTAPTASVPLKATSPTSWPDAPEDLTFSTLKEIETCPRRWALASASYPSLWDERGYPQKLHLKALGGTVVHAVLDAVTKELAAAGCPSVFDASAVAVLQRLGGLSKVVAKAIDQLIARTAINPRAAKQMEYFTRSLRAQAPELRGRVQTMLARRVLLSKPRTGGGGNGRARAALGHGVYCEIELRVPRLRWKGRVDLLTIEAESCEITDFKTGEPSEDHAFQLRIYAFLWNQDEVLNPTARIATQLTLAYAQTDAAIAAPTLDEMPAVETEITSRGAAARTAIGIHPPEARPNAEHCGFCGVRHLCDEYWKPEVRQQLAVGLRGEDKPFVDVEAVVEHRHGPKSWDLVIGNGMDQRKGLLRTNGDLDIQPGQVLRILNAAKALDDAESAGVHCFTVGNFSEVFVVSSPSQ